MSGDGPVTTHIAPSVPPALRGAVGRILRTGTVVSSVLLVAGLVVYAILGGGDLLAAPVRLHAGGGSSSGGGVGGDLVVLGLLVLVGTPLARVVTSVGVFAAARDRPFTLLTLLVFVVLVSTVVVGVLI